MVRRLRSWEITALAIRPARAWKTGKGSAGPAKARKRAEPLQQRLRFRARINARPIDNPATHWEVHARSRMRTRHRGSGWRGPFTGGRFAAALTSAQHSMSRVFESAYPRSFGTFAENHRVRRR